MLKVIIEGQSYDFDQERLEIKEMILIKRYTVFSKATEFFQAIAEEDPEALQAYVWIVRRRAGETGLTLDDVDFNIAEIRIESDDPHSDEVVVELPPTGESPSIS
jgi:hypothetical protein